jgi:hypothetical protein
MTRTLMLALAGVAAAVVLVVLLAAWWYVLLPAAAAVVMLGVVAWATTRGRVWIVPREDRDAVQPGTPAQRVEPRDMWL